MFSIEEDIAKDIVDWHKANMPNATLESQLLKLEEELEELSTAAKKVTDSKKCGAALQADLFEETADVLICCIVLNLRYNSAIGATVANCVASDADDEVKYLTLMAIAKKMIKNKARTWEEVKPGYYRHKEAEGGKSA